MSALHRAVKFNHQSIVELLVKQQNYKEAQENREVIFNALGEPYLTLLKLEIENGSYKFICAQWRDFIYYFQQRSVSRRALGDQQITENNTC